MKWKNLRSLSVCLYVLLVALCLVCTPIKSLKAEDDFDFYQNVTYGVYQNGNIVVSDPVAYNNSFVVGITQAIYNYYKPLYEDNSNFPSFNDVLNRVAQTFTSEVCNKLAENQWVVNIYKSAHTTNNFILVFTRVPKTQDIAEIIAETSINGGMDIVFNPSGATALSVVNNYTYNNVACYSMMTYLPAFSFHVSDSSWVNNYFVSFVNSNNNFQNMAVLSDFVNGGLTDKNIRAFTMSISVTVPALSVSIDTYSTSLYNVIYSSYLNYDTPRFLCYTPKVPFIFSDVVLSMYPLFYQNNENTNIQPSGQQIVYFKPQYITSGFDYSETFDLPVISIYEDLPIPSTPTPTPTRVPTVAPTWTPYPTATPFPPVNEIEGISQMMTLFTRKYEFNINGNVIGIRPLYLFVFTFLVGAIFKAIQGGDRN